MYITYSLAVLFLLVLAGYILQRRRMNLERMGFRRLLQDAERIRKENFDAEEKIQALNSQKVLLETKTERLIQEYEKKQSELQHFQEIVEETDEFLFEVDYKGRFIYANPVMLQKLGYREAEIQRISYQRLVPAENLNEVLSFYHRQYKEKKSSTYYEWEAVNRFGESVFVGLRLKMFFDLDGRILKVKGSARDLSVQKAAQKKSKLFDEWLEKYLMADPDPVMIFERTVSHSNPGKSSLIWANKAILGLMSLDWFEVEGLTLEQISSSLTESVMTKLQEPSDYVPWKTTKGPDRVFQLLARAGENILLIQLIDVTRPSGIFARIEKERRFFHQILENSGVEIGALSSEERYAYVNPSWEPNSDHREWMLGKSDEDIAKSDGADLSLALLRKSKFDEVRLLLEKVHFEEFILDKDQLVKTIIREVSPVLSAGRSLEGFVNLGLDKTEFQRRREQFMEILDRLFIRIRFIGIESSISSDHPSFHFLTELFSEMQGQNESRLAGHLFSQASPLHYYPATLSMLAGSIQNLSRKLKNIRLTEESAQSRKVIFLLPVVGILETMERAAQQHPEINFDVAVTFQELSEDHPGIQISITADSGEHQNPEVIRTMHILQSIWSESRSFAEVSEQTLVLRVPAILANQPDTHRIESPLKILRDKKIIAGPSLNRKAVWNADELRHHGATVTGLKTIFGINKYLSSGDFHLVIWWGDSVDDLEEVDVSLLKKHNLKLLFYIQDAGQIRSIPSGGNVIVKSPPVSGNEAVENAWMFSRSESDMDGTVAQERLESIDLNFEKLLEITEGDKDFMFNLFNSYFKSLAECKSEFEKHLNREDTDGLKFLLHKIRATIKTFDIRSLEHVLSDTIHRIEIHQIPDQTEKEKLIRKVHRICNHVRKNLTTFAATQGISL